MKKFKKNKNFYKFFWTLISITGLIVLSACSAVNNSISSNNEENEIDDQTKNPNSIDPIFESKANLGLDNKKSNDSSINSLVIKPKTQPQPNNSFSETNKNNSYQYSYNVSSNSPNFRFAVPQYNPETKEEFDFPAAINRPALNNGFDKNNQPIPVTLPQEGYSPNKIYDNNFKTSFNLVFENKIKNTKKSGISTERGTGWILDYQKTNNNKYPTIWYIATNVHVIDKLHSKTSYAPYNDFDKQNLETINFQMIKWNPPEEGFRTWPWHNNFAKTKTYQTGNVDSNSTWNYAIKSIPKTVFLGIDFLNTKPNQFNKKLSDEELIDFGVFEVEFSSPEIAKEITSNYANWDQKDKNKFLKTSYLKDQKQINPYIFYLAGFPNAVPTINRISMGSTNSDLPAWRDGETPEQTKQYQPLRDRGSSLGYWEYLSTFGPNDHKGIGDATLFLPYFYITYHGVNYTPAGLTYALENSNLVGGSSGSKVTNQNNEIVSIHAIGYKDENTSSVSFALKSEGFDQPAYHSYKTPAYDIIYGGFPGQKNSYYQAMKKIYENKSKELNTDLFNRSTKYN